VVDGPVNYLAAMPQFNPAESLLSGVQAGSALANAPLQREAAQLAIQKARDEQNTRGQFQSDLTGLLSNPTPASYSAMIAKYPEFQKSLEASWTTRSEGARNADVRHLTSLLGYAKTGAWDGLADSLEQRIKTDGDNDPHDAEALRIARNGTPEERKALTTRMILDLGAATGPDKAAAMLTALTKGDEAKVVGNSLVRPNDKGGADVLFTAPTGPQYREVDGKLVEIPGRTGSDQPSPAPASSDLFTSMVGVESAGQQFDKSGKPLRSPKGAIGAAQLLPGTGPEAAQLAGLEWNPARLAMDRDYNIALGRAYFQKQLSDFGDPALAAAAYNAGPGRVRAAVKQGGDNWLTKLPQETRSYVARTVGGPSSSSPGPRVVFDSGPGYQLLTPQENQQLGLDPNVKYQRSRDGQITALGGQSKAQLKQIPTPAVTGIQENLSTLKKIDQAIEAVNGYPNAVGLGTGMLGDAFTQRHDPKGVPVRALIGEIAGKKIHDISGAAVTAAEAPRFTPYVPALTDNPKTVIDKLTNFKNILKQQTDEQLSFYSEDNGFRPYKSSSTDGSTRARGSASEAVKVTDTASYAKVPSGGQYIDPQGRLRVKK
jgi:hypothetical protein